MLKKTEPPIYDVVNPDGKAPLMIACDHGGNCLPDVVNGLGCAADLFGQHIAYDIGARQVAQLLSDRFDAVALIANYSRLLVDLNRHPGDPKQMPPVSDDHAIPGNHNLDHDQTSRRLQTFFYPYHDMHGEMVVQLKSRYRRPIILSVHSFTPVFQGFERPWHFGVLWDQDRALAENLINGLDNRGGNQSPSLVIGDNQPYHANEPRGYAIVKHAAERNVEMALIEIRQDLIADAAGQQWAASVIFDTLSPLLDHQPYS